MEKKREALEHYRSDFANVWQHPVGFFGVGLCFFLLYLLNVNVLLKMVSDRLQGNCCTQPSRIH